MMWDDNRRTNFHPTKMRPRFSSIPRSGNLSDRYKTNQIEKYIYLQFEWKKISLHRHFECRIVFSIFWWKTNHWVTINTPQLFFCFFPLKLSNFHKTDDWQKQEKYSNIAFSFLKIFKDLDFFIPFLFKIQEKKKKKILSHRENLWRTHFCFSTVHKLRLFV